MSRALLARMEAEGFDCSRIERRGVVAAACSQCETLVISGVATHERGCPNARHECRGCNNLIPVNVRYCEDCR